MAELVIASAVASIIAAILANFFIARLHSQARNETLTLLQANTKRAIESLERDVRAARTVENTNSLSDPYGTTWASNPDVLVLSVPSKDTSGNLIYIDLLHNSIYTDNLIFFVDPATSILYKRILANSSAPGNAANTTCKPADVPAVCSQADIQVVEDVANLDLAYFDSTNTLIDLGAGGRPADAGSIQLTLQQLRTKSGATYDSTFTSKASMRNK